MDQQATMWEPGTVLMPVPLRFAVKVGDYVAALRAEVVVTPQSEGDVEDTETAIVGQRRWTRKMVADLADALPHAGVIALLTRCAESPGTWIIKSDVEDALGISAIQLRNELAAFSKLTTRLYGENIWPMAYKKSQGRYFYRMEDPVAQWWLDSQSAV